VLETEIGREPQSPEFSHQKTRDFPTEDEENPSAEAILRHMPAGKEEGNSFFPSFGTGWWISYASVVTTNDPGTVQAVLLPRLWEVLDIARNGT
jgi:hypothetical protein